MTDYTVRQLAKLFFAQGLQSCSESTRGTYRAYLPDFLRRYGGKRPDDLTPLDFAKFLKSRTTWKSQSTIATFDRCARNLFNWSVRMGLIETNPMMGMAVPSFTRRRNWTEAEFKTIVQNCRADMRRLLYFLAWTGCRPGEARSLRWEQIDWIRHCAVLQKHKTTNALRQPRPRIIVLVPKAERLLQWLYRHRIGELVFINRRKRAIKCNKLADRFGQIRDRLKLPADMKIYGLRHLFATNAIRRGVKLKTLAELLGHATVQHTERYVHLHGDVSHLLKVASQATGHKLDNNGKDSQ